MDDCFHGKLSQKFNLSAYGRGYNGNFGLQKETNHTARMRCSTPGAQLISQTMAVL